MKRVLSGRVIVVGCGLPAGARRLAAAGALLAAVEVDGVGRAAFFRTAAPVPDEDELAALAELVDELSR